MIDGIDSFFDVPRRHGRHSTMNIAQNGVVQCHNLADRSGPERRGLVIRGSGIARVHGSPASDWVSWFCSSGNCWSVALTREYIAVKFFSCTTKAPWRVLICCVRPCEMFVMPWVSRERMPVPGPLIRETTCERL